MKNFSFSLTIALVLHIIVLMFSGFLIGDRQTTFFEYNNAIPVQFGSGIKNSKSSAITPKNRSKIETPSGTTNLPGSSVSGSGIGNQNSNGSSNNNVSGNEAGTSFETSIVNYKGPGYPRMAQVRGLEGEIKVRIRVSGTGVPEDVNILKSSGHEVLDKAALDVIPQWRFQQSSEAYFVEKNIIFKLKN